MTVAGVTAPHLASRIAQQPGDARTQPAATDFAEQLGALLRGADQDQKVAEHETTELANERGDVVETMMALSKAELSLRTVAEVRNRALEAFHEILRLQI